MVFDALDGDNWSAQAARAGFPILVEYVRAGQRDITYGQWDAEIIERKLGRHVFLTQYGRPAGLIGNACAQYAKLHGITVPPINLMIVNKKDSLPGHGANHYIRHFCKSILGRRIDPERLDATQKRVVIEQAQDEILAFRDWEAVLHAYSLAESPTSKSRTLTRPQRRHPDPDGWHHGPESEAHKSLKKLIINNPHLVGLQKNETGEPEFRLWSGDRLDVFFPGSNVAVEVKTRDAGFDELHRGIFQCIKYRAVLRAQKIHDRQVPEGDSYLAIGGSLPADLRELTALFGIAVFENLVR